MFKLKVVVGLSLFAACVTFIISLAFGYHLETVLYRAFISAVVFGLLGVGMGIVAEKWIRKYSRRLNGNNLDVISENDDMLLTQTDTSEQDSNQPFKPFTPDKFEQITHN